MDFPRTVLQQFFSITKLISFHYFEYARGYIFEGEQHDFWEFLYVDKGEVEVRADDITHTLKQGDIIFHKPNEFHTVCVKQHHKPPNLIVMSFECQSGAMAKFENQALRLGDRERNLLSMIVQEGFQAFLPPFDSPSFHVLERNPAAPFGSEQVIRSYLEILFITIVRNGQQMPLSTNKDNKKLSPLHKESAEQQIVQQLIDYMNANVSRSLSHEQLCQTFHIGKSRLKELFQAQMGTGVLEYFKSLKIEQAKTLIREQLYNFTEVANLLGYGSIHYFSRDFKKSTGMSPTDYAKSVMARSVDRLP
ncbi:helix-turn-helix domain-containing protein [Paenibacillus solisilvae]|uniref:Helix-turn-helix domain-containing protein n=1 Tax=Paenibacillus solisilvae TaxID=2486751 RepID=A0ABW0W799_9BACL